MRKILSTIVLAALFVLPLVAQAQNISTYHLRMAVNDSTMGFTVPSPGDYTYYEDDTVHIYAEAYPGYILIGWERIAIIHFDTYTEIDTLSNDVACGDSAGWSFLVGPYYGDEIWVHKAIFIPDTATVTFGTNDPAMGTTVPAPGTYQYADGDTVYLTAVPNSGYQLTAWVQCGNETCDTMYWLADLTTLPIDIDPTIICPAYGADNSSWTALFAPVSNTVTINVQADEPDHGTVTGGGTYTIGDSVTVSATNGHSYQFSHWSNWYGQTLSYDNPYTFTATEDMTLVAHFYYYELDSADVIISVNDPSLGTTNPAPGTYRMEESNPFTVTAIPTTGNSFVRWTDEDGATISMENPYTFGIWSDIHLIANFVQGEYIPDSVTLTVAVNDPAWGTTTPAPGTYTFAENEQVQFLATPNTGYYVMGWAVSASMMGMTIQDTMFGDDEFFTDFFDLVGVQNIVLTALFTDDSTYAPDRVYITFATNSPEMGTTNPAPGTYTYNDGDEYTVTAIPYDGYRLMGWTMSFFVEGQVITYPTDEAVPTITATAYADEGYNRFTLTAIFGPDNVSPDSLTIIVGVNNPAGGTVTPAAGTYHYGLGDEYSVSATANAGYHHVGWHVTVAHPVYGIVQDEVVNVPNITISGVVDDEELLGYVHTIIALFESNTGVDDIEAVSINVYGNNGRIVFNGVEGREVHVYDINGRMLHHSRSANATETYNVPATGIYLVKVSGFNAKRVVVLK